MDVFDVCQPEVPIFVVGTKSDLVDERKVTYEDLTKWTTENKQKYSIVNYCEVSSTDQYRNTINALFEAITRHVAGIPDTEIRRGSFKVDH